MQKKTIKTIVAHTAAPQDRQPYARSVYRGAAMQGRPLSITAGIPSPGWLKDSVMPCVMPNGMSYGEMRELVRFHLNDSRDIPELAARAGGIGADPCVALRLCANAVEQRRILGWYAEFLREISRGVAETYGRSPERCEEAWLCGMLIGTGPKLGLSVPQMIEALEGYGADMNEAMASAKASGKGSQGAAIALYRPWMAGEELMDGFAEVLDGIIHTCRKLIKKDREAHGKAENVHGAGDATPERDILNAPDIPARAEQGNAGAEGQPGEGGNET